MRRIVAIMIVPLIGLFILACARQDRQINVSENKALVSPSVKSSPSTTATGSGMPGSAAIDDAPAPGESRAKSPLPPPTGFVNDYAKVIDTQTDGKLEATLKQLKERSKIEFAVVTVDTTGEQSSFDYAMAVARGWGVGSKEGDGGGIILLVAIKDRRWECRWTRNLEADLQGSLGNELGQQMNGPFRQGKYSEGITNAVQLVISKLSERRGFTMQE
ncbi:MAG: uncharacterized protein QOJ02_813 [Acidobacteriota bacterium]|jgi:uncharacterized protein|nr:uncharacterized protein [Acidobacteriota bacterium]